MPEQLEMTMAPSTTQPTYITVADLLARIGVPPERIRLDPHPGTATEADLLQTGESGASRARLDPGLAQGWGYRLLLRLSGRGPAQRSRR